MVSLSNNTQGNVNITTNNSGNINLKSDNDTDINANTNGNSQRAKSWAVGEGLIDGVDYSAKYYAGKAKESEEIASHAVVTARDEAQGYAQQAEQAKEDIEAELGNYVSTSSLTTILADYVLSSDLSTTLANYVTSANLTTILGDYATQQWVISQGFITSSDLPTNHVTTDTAQDISGRKTFLGENAIYFKQQATWNKLGFTLYNPNNTELGALEYRPSTIGTSSLLAINCPQTTGGYVGFRYWGTPAVNIVAPKVPTAGNYYIPTHITDGTNTVTASNTGSVDISSLLPDVSGYVTNTSLATTLADYQPLLVSGTNIKTINNTSLLGRGNIDVLQNTATGSNSITILGTATSDLATTNIGYGSTASGKFATAIGESTTASGDFATAIGKSATASSYATALGRNADASGDFATAIGESATASGYFATALGRHARVSGNYAIQIGSGINSTASTLAIGFYGTNYSLLDGTTGLIPDARISSNIARTNQIPTNNNQLTNGAGYITSADLPTNHVTTDTAQSISGQKTFTSTIKSSVNNSLALTQSTGEAFGVTVTRTDANNEIKFGIGQGGDNRGIWDVRNNKWAFNIADNGKAYALGNEIASKSDLNSLSPLRYSRYSIAQVNSTNKFIKLASMTFTQSGYKDFSYLFWVEILEANVNKCYALVRLSARWSNTSYTGHKFEILEKYGEPVSSLEALKNLTYAYSLDTTTHRITAEIWLEIKSMSYVSYYLRPTECNEYGDYSNTPVTLSNNIWTYYNQSGNASSIASTAITSGLTQVKVTDATGVRNENDLSQVIKTWTGTKAQYDAIVTKDSNTIYYVEDATSPIISILESLYPVGSIYIGTMSACPLQTLGVGTWQLVATDRVLQGAGTRGSVGSTVNESLPNIKGQTGGGFRNYGKANWGALYGEYSYNTAPVDGNYTGLTNLNFDASRYSSTYQDNAPVQQDAYLVNIWERIS